jgi:hypothetical protein
MDVRTIPLATGQELVVDLVFIDESFIHVNTPMVFQVLTHPQTGETKQGFGEWPALRNPEEERVRIPVSSVLAMPMKTHEEVERSYVANITGLALPPATPKILLG